VGIVSSTSRLYEIVITKLRNKDHSKVLKILLESFAEGGNEAVEERIKEMVDAIEEEQ